MTDEQVRSYIKTLRNQAEALIRRADDEARPIALTLYQEQIERRSMRSDAKWKTELAAHLEAGLADSEQAAGMSGVTRCLTCGGEGFLAGYCSACHEGVVIRAEAAEAERDALAGKETLLLAELAAAQDRAHYAATELDAMAAKLEWLREHGLHVRLHGPKYHEHMGISKVFGSLQDDAEFYTNLDAAAVAAEKDGDASV